MKKIALFLICVILLSSCSSLSHQEQIQLRKLASQGVTVDRPVGTYEKPASGIAAGLLNILPGIGNFYLGCGNGAESNQIIYGILNFLFWPFSPVWAIPQAAIDADNINKRDMIYYYLYDENGKKELRKAGIRIRD